MLHCAPDAAHPATRRASLTMPLLWCAVSGHGFGHAAQVIPLINALAARVAGLRVILRTPVPRTFFDRRLACDWTLSHAPQDVGCVQQSPLTIDVPATWQAHERLHADWPQRVAEEAEAILAAHPSLVLSNISHLAVAAGARTGLPTVGLCSLSWDRILEPMMDGTGERQAAIIRDIETAYRLAAFMVCPRPSIAMTSFRAVHSVGPLGQVHASEKDTLRAHLGLAVDERLVLAAFGGIALDSLPFDRMEAMKGYRFLVSGPAPAGAPSIVSIADLPFSFGALLASVDAVLTKPGYNTVVEAVAERIPILYVRRYNFADEQSLVDFAHRFGRAVELSRQDFEAGEWEPALDRLWNTTLPAEPPPALTGAEEAAALLEGYFT
jgi:hypothetical protein